MGFINVPWDKEDVCLSGNGILKLKDWKRLFLSALEHGDDMHLYYNMASFLIKGRSLEKRYGSKCFAIILIFLTILTSGIYVLLAQAMSEVFENDSYMKSCAIGFSGSFSIHNLFNIFLFISITLIITVNVIFFLF